MIETQDSAPTAGADVSPSLEAVLASLQPRIPCATYRLQFSRAFTFRDALALVPYLHELGITDLYASPILEALPGSTHGYDICNHSRLNPELGTPDDFDKLVAALRERGMGLLLDIVPNHMGIDAPCNEWWMDVLENGPASRYARYFDIDWHPVKPELENKVLLPILEDQYGIVLDSGKLTVVFEGGAFFLLYGSHRLPLAPRSYRLILEEALESLSQRLHEDSGARIEFESVLTALRNLPGRHDVEPERLAERRREKEVIKQRLAYMYSVSPEVMSALDRALFTLNGIPGDPRSFDRLDALLQAQPYRLAFWRVAGDEINYRRFFDINTMAALRTEEHEVFDATHALVFDLIRSGSVTGLRVDHPDGLWHPAQYFRRLQAAYVEAAVEPERRSAVLASLFANPDTKQVRWPLYVVVEKILTESEPLPADWAVYGTTGYDFMAQTNGLFVDKRNETAFDALYRAFTGGRIGGPTDFADLEYESKQRIMRTSLASEINSLAHRLERISEKNRYTRDFTLSGLRDALRDVIASLTIYRTYTASTDAVSLRDQQFVEAAVRSAVRRNAGTSRTIFDFLRDTLLLRNLNEFPEADHAAVLEFVMKFQQITGPVMAKSIEDTTFYVYNRLASLNEVGGSPAVFGLSLNEFHDQNRKRLRRWPNAMLALSTHDTKRSEDVRARLNALSELPTTWAAALDRWHSFNADKKTVTDTGTAMMVVPAANDEYLLYQSMLGAWPFELDLTSPEEPWNAFRERIQQYMVKAMREAKVHTSWTNPNDAYEHAMSDFIDAIFDRQHSRDFLIDFQVLWGRLASAGMYTSLSQTVLKLTSPGVPDTYRGTELWDFSLVDPDNRRPVDYKQFQRLLDDVKARTAAPDYDCGALADELLATAEDGRIKLYVVTETLAYRRDHEALFNEGDYVPLLAMGAKAEHVCAFARVHANRDLSLTVVPRLLHGLTNGANGNNRLPKPPLGESVWGDTWLPLPDTIDARAFHDLYTGDKVDVETRDDIPGLRLASVLRRFPVAVLVSS